MIICKLLHLLRFVYGWAEFRADVNNVNVLYSSCKFDDIIVAFQTNLDFLDRFLIISYNIKFEAQPSQYRHLRTDGHTETNRLFTLINLKRLQPICSLAVKQPNFEDPETTTEFLQLMKLILKSLRYKRSA